MRCELVAAVGAQVKLGPLPRKRPFATGQNGRRGRIGVDERARQLLPVELGQRLRRIMRLKADAAHAVELAQLRSRRVQHGLRDIARQLQTEQDGPRLAVDLGMDDARLLQCGALRLIRFIFQKHLQKRNCHDVMLFLSQLVKKVPSGFFAKLLSELQNKFLYISILQFCRCGGLLDAKGNPDGFLSLFSSLRYFWLGSFLTVCSLVFFSNYTCFRRNAQAFVMGKKGPHPVMPGGGHGFCRYYIASMYRSRAGSSSS